jgi:hypothetical protein
MPTYIVSIEPISYEDSQTGFKLTPQEFEFLNKSATAIEHEIDQIKAFLDVYIDPQSPNTPVVCSVEPSKKHAQFKTFRKEQYLDLVLRPEQQLDGRVHFYGAEIIGIFHKKKGVRVEYLDTSGPKPDWKHWKFDEIIPGNRVRVRLVFGMDGETPAFSYNIYIHDTTGSPEGIPCDPQASNDPPAA